MHLGITNIIGASRTLFGPGAYSGNVSGSVSVSGNDVTITGAATIAPDGVTGASVLVCDHLTINGSGVLSPSTNSKGLVVFAKTGVTLNSGGRIHIDKLGKAGNFGSLTVLDLVPVAIKNKLKTSLAAYVVQGDGAAGGAGASGGTVAGSAGESATSGAMKTGGGGSGSLYGAGGSSSGSGGKGGPCCGGAGSGGSWNNAPVSGVAAGDYGGAGGAGVSNGYASPGGAGDPVGSGVYGGASGQGAGGGLLMIFTPSLTVASGAIISADGAQGGAASAGQGGSGGSAGGGCVVIGTLAGGYSNSGTVRASGGAAVPSGQGSYPSGAGGDGSVNTLTLA